MPKQYYEVVVPAHRAGIGLRHCRHPFTGEATSEGDALRIANEVYCKAVAAAKAGSDLPTRRPDGWGASGLRVDWRLNWNHATASLSTSLLGPLGI